MVAAIISPLDRAVGPAMLSVEYRRARIMFAERRKHGRIRKSFAIHVERKGIVETSRGDEVPAALVDVSPGGVGFTSPRTLDTGSRVQVTIDIETATDAEPHVTKVTAPAVIRWCRKQTSRDAYLVGAQFLEMRPPDAEQWRSFFSKWDSQLF
jgi:c-di-GMP-binding flagellar brake protein YcgR